MAEYIPPFQGLQNEGHILNTETAMLELYRLINIFLASKNLAALRTNFPGEGFDPFYVLGECEADEITRILLMVAVTARVIDDREDRVYDRIGTKCGVLIKNIASPQNEDLTLRDACNKIIHASRIRLDVEYNDKNQPYLNPFIYLYGQLGANEWKATIDVLEFSKEYVSCVRNF